MSCPNPPDCDMPFAELAPHSCDVPAHVLRFQNDSELYCEGAGWADPPVDVEDAAPHSTFLLGAAAGGRLLANVVKEKALNGIANHTKYHRGRVEGG